MDGPRPDFDHARMNVTLYNGLNSALDTSAFLTMVSDYMQHLRAGPRDSPTERETADRFLEMIDNERAWPVVKYTIREFRDIDAVNNTQLPTLLRYVLHGVKPRMTEVHPFVRTTNLDKIEDLAHTRVVKARIDGVVYHLDGEEHASQQQRELSAALLNSLVKAQEKLGLADDKNNDKGVNEKSG